MCPRERLVIISKQTGLSFVLKRIGPLAAIITLALYILVLYSTVTSNPPEYLSVSIYSESFIETACQHLLLLVGIDILTYRRYYDTPPILVGHQLPGALPRPCRVPEQRLLSPELEFRDGGGAPGVFLEFRQLVLRF